MGTIFIRTLIIYVFVLIALRLMGKREIGQLQPYELVVTIMIADLASVPMQDVSIPILQGIIPILALVVGQIVISFLNLKSGIMRRLICGKPTIMIEKGKIVEKSLKDQKYTINGLLTQLRVAGYSNLKNIDYAILETSGAISVIPKEKSMPVTKEDMKLEGKYSGFPRAYVIDGSYIHENMKAGNFSEKTIDEILEKEKVKLEDVFLLVIDESDEIFLQKKENA
ncbi:MAG: DUF421 domain-containing protein [Clostridia bacterium]|nr:DUF421 domain-containing protein [Clostridia bacterium]